MTSARIVFVRIALCLLRGRGDVALYLGQMKTLMSSGPLTTSEGIADTWDIPDVIQMVCHELCNDGIMLALLAQVLDGLEHPDVLEIFDRWTGTPPVSLDVPWPD